MAVPKLIGILGRSRMGKDTIAGFLHQFLGGNESVTICRLSKTLKEAVCVLYGYTPEYVEGPTKELVDPRYNMTPRNAIQGLCDYIMKKHGDDFFSKQLFHAYDQNVFQGKYVIIPDIRYEHDLHEIRKRGGIVIKVVRPFGHEVPNHPWEDHIESLKGDFTLLNRGSTQELYEHVRTLFNQISKSNAL